MKTAVSIPDELFEAADRLARRLGRSRSRLYADAIGEYLARHDPDEVTATMDAVLEGVGGEPDPALQAAARLVLEQTEW